MSLTFFSLQAKKTADFSYSDKYKMVIHDEDFEQLEHTRDRLTKSLKLIAGDSMPEQRKLLVKDEIDLLQAKITKLEQKVRYYQVPVFKGFEEPVYQIHDYFIMEEVRAFNNDVISGLGNPTKEQLKSFWEKGGYLKASIIKADMIQENGGHYGPRAKRATLYWQIDPMTVNMGGDWDSNSKAPLGLKKNPSNSRPSGDLQTNIRAGIRLIARKGFHPAARPAGVYPKFHVYDGWPKALERYGPPRQAHFYRSRVLERAANPNQKIGIAN